MTTTEVQERTFASRLDANAEIERYPGQLELRPQYVGALDAWIIEGNYKSKPCGQPYVLRIDGRYIQHHYNKVATR